MKRVLEDIKKYIITGMEQYSHSQSQKLMEISILLDGIIEERHGQVSDAKDFILEAIELHSEQIVGLQRHISQLQVSMD